MAWYAFGHATNDQALQESCRRARSLSMEGGQIVTEHERQSPLRSAELIPESVVRQVADERRDESELALVTSTLSKVPELTRDPGVKVSDYIDGLVKQRAELLERVRPIPTVGSRATRIDSLVSELSPFFTSWKVGNLPPFSEGLNDPPIVDGTSGGFKTASLPAGAVEFWGNPRDTGIINPHILKWWNHNWTCSYVFPAAPSTGTLHYRFSIETSWEAVLASALSGIVSASIVIGRTSDAETDSPLGYGAETELALPFLFTLPEISTNIHITQPLIEFSGAIEVQAGKEAAIGLICGIHAGLASGYVEMLGGSMWTRLVAPGQPSDYAIRDQLEYVFEPDWWVHAVGQRFDSATAS